MNGCSSLTCDGIRSRTTDGYWVLRAIAVAALLVLTPNPAAAHVRLFMAPDGQQNGAPPTGSTTLTMAAGTTQQVSVWIEDTIHTTSLNAHQVIIPWSAAPQTGATATVSYLNTPPTGGGGGSVFIDPIRPDNVFAGQPVSPPAYNEAPAQNRFGWIGNLASFQQGVSVVGIRYLGEFEIEALSCASGQFEVSFVPSSGAPGTRLFGPFGAVYPVNELQNLTVVVSPASTPPCTVVSYDPALGCVLSPAANGSVCIPGDPCYVSGYCSAGNCVGSVPTPVGTACTTGNPCTVSDSCDGAGNCVPGSPAPFGTPCNNGNPCTHDFCSATGNCVASPPPPGTPCNDGNPCTLNDNCVGYANCTGIPAPCDDFDVCTVDSCDITHPLANPVTGCVNSLAPLGTPCNNGSLCTVDSCDGAGNCVGSPVCCDDFDDCTVDYCDPVTGCLHDVFPCTQNSDCAVVSPSASCIMGDCVCCSNLSPAHWLGPTGGDLLDGANWDLGIPPSSRPAVLNNASAADNAALLSSGGSITLCNLDVAGNPAGTQRVQVGPGSVLATTNGTTLDPWGVFELQGGELEGGTVQVQDGAELGGFGTVSADLVNNGDLVGPNTGATLEFSGQSFENSPSGYLVTGMLSGSQIVVASASVTQAGEIEVAPGAKVSFTAGLLNEGQIKVQGTVNNPGELFAQTLSNAPSLTPLPPRIDMDSGVLRLGTNQMLVNAPGAAVFASGSITRLGDPSLITFFNQGGNSILYVRANQRLDILGQVVNASGAYINIDQAANLNLNCPFTHCLINNGYIGPGPCTGCFGPASAGTLYVSGDVTLGAESTLQLPGGRLRVGGNLDIAIDAADRFDMAAGEIEMDGFFLFGEQHLEMLSPDLGPGVAQPPFAIGKLRIGPSLAAVVCVDDHDNSGSDSAEVLYVSELVLEPGISLDLGGRVVYYESVSPPDPCAAGSGVSITGCENLVPMKPTLCSSAAACCDVDGNAIRDDACTWCGCDAGTCQAIAATFADMGGAFGDCDPDGFVNLFDRSHALACFAGTNPCDSINIDAGGPFGDCAPDGFCNIFDASHALAVFAGTNPCTCPASSAPQHAPEIAGGAVLVAESDAATVVPGSTIRVRVFMEGRQDALGGYQLHVGVSGGRRGSLVLEDITIEPRADFVFAGRDDRFEAFNTAKGQMLCGLEPGTGPAPVGSYLATFTYRASKDAAGIFVVDVLHDEAAGDQTFLLADLADKIQVQDSAAAVIVAAGADRYR